MVQFQMEKPQSLAEVCINYNDIDFVLFYFVMANSRYKMKLDKWIKTKKYFNFVLIN